MRDTTVFKVRINSTFSGKIANMAEGPDLGDPVAKCVRSSSTPTLSELSNELDSVVDWHSLGVKLGLKGHELSIVAANYRGNTRCKHEMLIHWLKNDKCPTWKAVVDALSLMGERAVALKIRDKHCSSSITNGMYLKLVPLVMPFLSVHKASFATKRLVEEIKFYVDSYT